MENQSKCCSSSCWTKCIAITALSISLFCAGILVGQCCASKGKCKTKCGKSYKKCHTNKSSDSTCTYEKKKKVCADDCTKECCTVKTNNESTE